VAEPPIAKSIPVEAAVTEPALMKPAKSAPVHTREATVKSTHSAAVEASKSAAVEAAATPAMRPSVGGIWLAERGGAQESSCGCQNPCHPGPGSGFV
jgi:hypothetical protein